MAGMAVDGAALRASDAERSVVAARWPSGVRCPRCSGTDLGARSREAPRRWRCRACRYDFSVTTGTLIHGSKVEMSKWVSAALAADARPPALMRTLGVSAPAARRMARVLESTAEPPGEDRLRALVRLGSDPADARAKSVPATVRPADGNPVSSMTAGQRAVMSALRARLRGCTVSGLAERAGLSERHTRRCLRALEGRGLTRSEKASVPWGYGSVRARLWSLARTGACLAALPYLPRHPEAFGRECPERVPPRFWYLFWSGSQGGDLRLPEDALFVASTLLDSPDAAAESWALRHLPVQALRVCRTMRGYDTGRTAALLDAAIEERSRARDR